MRVRPHYLELAGYRLPTEVEWEYACRAGAVTSRYYGETEELLGKYAWYSKNSQQVSMLPVGSLKPNDFGLFDMLGNEQQWCQDKMKSLDVPRNDPDDEVLSDEEKRVLRGGSFLLDAGYARAAHRVWGSPDSQNYHSGFRVARTIR